MYDKVYFIGTGRVARECLRILKERRDDVECLNVEREEFPIVKPACKRLDIEYKSFEREELKQFLLDRSDETLIVSAHNGYIFPSAVVDKPNVTIINFHNAYLPKYRGRNAPTWEIFNGEEYGGATWHLVDSGVDTGAILEQEKVPIADDEIALTLLTRSAQVGVELFQKHADEFLETPRSKVGGAE